MNKKTKKNIELSPPEADLWIAIIFECWTLLLSLWNWFEKQSKKISKKDHIKYGFINLHF
jgi:hypothetical protein